ncbi:putative assembly protein [Roseibium album]|nr:putative assembly protein [Roseibium album]
MPNTGSQQHGNGLLARCLKWLLIVFGVLLLTGTAFVTTVVYAPFANSFRSELTAEVLGQALERPVQINGEVSVNLNDGVEIVITEIRLAHTETASSDTSMHIIAQAGMSFPIASLLSGSIAPAAVSMRGATVYLAQELPDDANGDEVSHLKDYSSLVTRVLTDPLSEDLTLEDIRFVVPDTGNGWGYDIMLDRLSSQAPGPGTELEITAEVQIDETRANLSAVFTNPHKQPVQERTGPFSLDLDLPAVHARLEGTLDVSDPVATLTAQSHVNVESLGGIQDLLELKRVVEGAATYSATYEGPLDALTASDMKLDLQLNDVASVQVVGQVDNLTKGRSADLVFEVDLSPLTGANSPDPQAFDVEVERFGGRIKGDRERFFITDLVVQTNVASGELQRIGPIHIDRVVRDLEGHLGLLGIEVVSGDPDDPVYAFSGRIRDTLQLQDIDITGQFNLDIAQLFSWPDLAASGDLGRLNGSLALSDAGGTFSMTEFNAETEGTGYFSLALDREDLDREGSLYPAIRASVDVPDLEALGQRLALASTVPGRASFSGSAYYSPEEVGVLGNLNVDKTHVGGDVNARKTDGDIHLSGGVRSELLYLKDVRKAIEIAQFLSGSIANAAEKDSIEIDADVTDNLSANLKVSIDRIAEAGKAASGLDADLSYRDEMVVLDPLTFRFIGGAVKTTLKADLSADSPRLALGGRIDKLNLGTLLSHLGIKPLVSGSLNASYDLTGTGRSIKQFVKSMSGRTTVSIWGGEIGSRIIDLSGMSLISWAFAAKGDSNTAKLVCAVLPMSFKNGRGSSKSLVIETENVQIAGGGTVDLRKGALDLSFVPRAKSAALVEIVTTFAIRGPLANPEVVVLSGGGAGRAVAEVVTAPIGILGAIFSGSEAAEAEPAKSKPCVLPKAK